MRRHTLVLIAAFLLISSATAFSQTETQQASRSSLAAMNNGIANAERSGLPRGTIERALSQRLAAVESLMETDPVSVRNSALPADVTERLVERFPELARLIERDEQKTGRVEAAIADDMANQRSNTHWYLRSANGAQTRVFPTNPRALENMIGRVVKVSGRATQDRMTGEAVSAVEPAESDGGIIASSVLSTSVAPVCSTLGDQKVAVIVVNQPSGPSYPAGFDQAYWNQAYFGVSPRSTNSYWNEASFGKTTASGAVLGPYMMSADHGCDDYSAMFTDAVSAAIAGGADLTPYNRISIVFPVSTCTYGGLGSLGCWAATDAITWDHSENWIPVSPYYSTGMHISGVLSHEFGHNLGLLHSESMDFGTIPLGAIDYKIDSTQPVSSANPSVSTYGDQYATMGDPWSSEGHYSSFNEATILDWMTPSQVTTLWSEGTSTVTPYEDNAGTRALRVLRDARTGSWLWIEYRQPIGTYDGYFIPELYLSNNNIYQGAHVYLEDHTNGNLHLLHFNPISATNDFRLSAMLPGTTWNDPYSPLNLKVNSADSNGLSVSVGYYTPCATVAISPDEFSSAGGSGTVTVSAAAGCAWQASTATSWITLTGTTSGSGNGSFGFDVAANASTDQRDGLITVDRQSIDVRQAGGTSTIAIRPAQPVLSTEGPVTVTVTDTNGYAALNYLYLQVQDYYGCFLIVQTNTSPMKFTLINPVTGSGTWVNVGDPQTISNANCSMSGQDLSVSESGNQIQLTVNLAYTAAFAGVHPLTSYGCESTTCSTSVRVGTVLAGFASVMLGSPNGGERWGMGTKHSIDWSSRAISGNVILSLNKGGSFYRSIATVPVSNKTYSWQVPLDLAVANDYSVTITSVANPTVTDVSDASFSVTAEPALIVRSPNGGENLTPGNLRTITWYYSGISGNVTLALLKGGVGYKAIATVPVGSNGMGSYDWTIPPSVATGSDYKVRIMSATDSSKYDASDATFSLWAPLTVRSPNGGETWFTGTTRSILWNFSGTTGDVTLALLKAGVGYKSIATVPVGTNGSGSYSWAIPMSIASGSDYKIRIMSATDAARIDTSDATFTIQPGLVMHFPNGGETWATGSRHAIQWNFTGITGNVTLTLLKAGVGYKSIATVPIGSNGSGSYDWTVPMSVAAGSDYKIRIMSATDSTKIDTSDATFTIKPGLIVQFPTNPASFLAGSSFNILWGYAGNTGNVSITLLKGGVEYQTIATVPIGSNGKGLYPWTIPATLPAGSDYKIRIMSTTDANLVDASDANFTVHY